MKKHAHCFSYQLMKEMTNGLKCELTGLQGNERIPYY
ncbi:hypothetical protein Desca_1047 [Desulfotomaculum nigrificans CO-1-SRB]|uniref:Uncharacterized protein n=1 Tax=Desulfotomaculum nigrificans (strain DSM 14880 / VKM B-2319 / CO-1-SRB) TaxID=868595 RepID=F6B313_DESCC|nr:hypothetical protein Desca_1047 [Desulfotomaculum nigrificans CO-1-SRB]